tara:strand:- start:445 stop:642 length:198 start_codon:yes stop_codon:yes gene_type:complete
MDPRKTFTSWYDGKTYEFLYAHVGGEIWRCYTAGGDESDSELINVVDEKSNLTEQALIDYFEPRQ